MIVNQAALQSIYLGFKTIFNKAFSDAKPLYEKVATVVPSTTKEEIYKWLGKIPRLKQWIGERVLQNLAANEYRIKNVDWESTVSVERNDIEDDAIGLYNPLVQSLGNAAATHPDEIVFGLLPLGFTSLCYDGQYFFDADHKDEDGPVQSNKSTKKLTPENYGAARAAMASLLDEHGKPLGIQPNLLVVPPQLGDKGRKILNAGTIVEIVEGVPVATDNIYKDSAELLVAPWLANYPNMWFLLDTTKPVKPLIYQVRRKANFIAKDQVTDDNVFWRKEFVYGTDCRDNAGFGLWQLAHGSTGVDD